MIRRILELFRQDPVVLREATIGTLRSHGVSRGNLVFWDPVRQKETKAAYERWSKEDLHMLRHYKVLRGYFKTEDDRILVVTTLPFNQIPRTEWF